MQVRVGTSGYAYKEWNGSFYPEKTKPADMLGAYATRLGTVEINNTFYRMPKRDVVRRWKEQVPSDFRFVLKASGRITHKQRLKDVEESVGYFVRASEQLEETRGPSLFQLPPYLRKDVDRLRAFLDVLPEGWPAALEFRHESWHDEDVVQALRERNCALVVSHGGKFEPLCEATAPFGYLRLRQASYTDEELDAWEQTIRAQDWSDVYVYFKHEEDGAGPEFARRFGERFHGAQR